MTQTQTLIDGKTKEEIHFNQGYRAGAEQAYKNIKEKLNSPEMVERVEKVIDGWLPYDGLAYPTEQMAKAAIAEIKQVLIGEI